MCTSFIDRLHRDEHGSISIVSVFAVLMLAVLLGMMMNVGRHVNDKIHMQNTADACAYSGGVVLARGMNTLAFTNHLLFDVFALTAFMREAAARNAERHTPEVLDAWNDIGPVFLTSGFPKFERLGTAIVRKVPLEQDLVFAFSEWAAASSERTLPLVEEILQQNMIPEFQRAVVEATGDIAQTATMEVARRNGSAERNRGRMLGALWRSSVRPVGGPDELFDPSLPVVDPLAANGYEQDKFLLMAKKQRRELSHKYLGDWNNESMLFFGREAKMCQFKGLWQSFTCGHLERLLEQEYPLSNLPHVLRTQKHEIADGKGHLEEEFTFLGVVYRDPLPEMLPGLFRNPIEGDAMAYAQVRLFIPRRRLVWHWSSPTSDRRMGGVPGEFPELPDEEDGEEPAPAEGRWVVGRRHYAREEWDLLNQHWTVQLVPATSPELATVLQTVPSLPEFSGQDIRPPHLGDLTAEDIGRISPH